MIALYRFSASAALCHSLKKDLVSNNCLMIIRNGSCCVRAGDRLLLCSKSAMVFLPAGIAIRGAELKGSAYLIFFNPGLYRGNMLFEMCKNHKDGSAVGLCEKEYGFILKLTDITYARFRTSSARVLEMFLVVCHFIIEQTPGYQVRSDVLFIRFCELVSLEVCMNRQVSHYADKLCITPGYLKNIVKAKTGLTPKAYIGRELFLKAVLLLYDTSHPIETIAELLGYRESGAFSTFFKKMAHLSPSAFRSEHLKRRHDDSVLPTGMDGFSDFPDTEPFQDVF